MPRRAAPHSARPAAPPVRVVPKHHALVRFTHWTHVPLLLGLLASGLSIYWAAPVFLHAPDPATGHRDWGRDLGIALAGLLGDRGGEPRWWLYDHLSLGTRLLADALRLHWALAFLYMANGALYLVGLAAGGGWRALWPRRGDPAEALAMIRYYLGVLPALLRRRPWPHPPVRGKYNALQRGAYAAMPLLGALVVASGWAMHKPVQLGWLERLFVNYDGARVVHFACMIALGGFLVPHVVLVAADGWDTFRSMITGWSKRVALAVAPPAAGRAVEPPALPIEAPAARLAGQSRRDFLLFAAGVAAAAAGGWWLLPEKTKARLAPGDGHDRLDSLAARIGLTRAHRERVLDRALTFDDDVAEALYSRDRRVRTYRRSQITPLRNNYAGQTPRAESLAGWSLQLSGLASGTPERFGVERLLAEFPFHDDVTRFVCVEGWSAVAWFGGVRFADLLERYPPAPGARWAALRSSLNLDGAGRPHPYYVSLDLDTARHPQVLLATHFAGRPLPLAHGAPLRLRAPMKLGLKNIKALTEIAYSAVEPPDYWNERGYSKYDGL